MAACSSPEQSQPAQSARPSTTEAPPGSDPAADGTVEGNGRVHDDGDLGSAGPVLLDPAVQATSIEVDRSPDADLTIDPRSVLGEQLREHGGKRSVEPVGDSEVPGQDVYTERDLRSIAESARVSRSDADRPAVYVLVLEGRYENERVTGVAFGATAFAVFPAQIGGGLLGLQRESFERVVVVHELGAFHEDAQHPGHARSRGSVMYWAIEDVSIRNLFAEGPPTEFNDDDQEEMERIRSV